MKKFKLIKWVDAGRYMSNNKQALLYSQLDMYLPARWDTYTPAKYKAISTKGIIIWWFFIFCDRVLIE